MGRFLLIVIALLVLVWLVRGALGARARRDRAQAKGAGERELVACAHCGVHLPIAEARSTGGRHYCSEEHGRLGPREP
jgi:uncharacterized protein